MNKEQIKEINEHISDGLKQWSDIVMLSDMDGWSYHLNYTEADLFNAMYIFNHVISNISIKSGYINNEDEAYDACLMFKEVVKQAFGIDTLTLLEKEDFDN